MFESARIGGIDLYYQEAGEGPAVVFLHGFGGNHLSWWQQVPTFSEEYRCIAPDQRRFGRSVDGPDGPGVSAFVDDLAALLDHLDVERAAVVGHSMSGWTVASFATQYPDRTAALVLSATPGGLLSPERHAELQEEAGALPEVDPLSPEAEFLSESISELNVDAPAEWEETRVVLDELSLDPDGIVDAGIPTFLIAGEADQFMPPTAVRTLSERLGAEFAIVEGAGHSSNFDRPAEFNRQVRGFLDANAEF